MTSIRTRFFAAVAIMVITVGMTETLYSQQMSPAIEVEGWATGKVQPIPIDPGRPWGWAVRAYMDNPDQRLYNRAKAKLLSGEQVFAHTINTFDVERYCREAPHYDFTWFEMQHSNLWFDQVAEMISACPRLGAAPLIRLPEAQEGFVQKAMDMGALGIIIPTVDDFTQARAASRWVRFPPRDRRSLGSAGATHWNAVVPEGSTWRNTVNDNMLVIVMIETIEGVNNAYEIAVQPGVDVVMLGNSDLQSFSQLELNNPEYRDLLIRVRNATYLAGKYWGNTAGTIFASGTPLSADSRLNQHGRTADGWTCTPEACTPPNQ
jgi:2-keto-3-deoxy-L-rhamnonate aldolase RhmA